jgi:hypothetical protein
VGSGNVSKEDIQREKREMLVKKGVQERGKLEVKRLVTNLKSAYSYSGTVER